MDETEYERMVQANFQTITRIICRRNGVKGCYNGRDLNAENSPYNEDGTMETARDNYLSDGTLADDGTIVCDACYVGF